MMIRSVLSLNDERLGAVLLTFQNEFRLIRRDFKMLWMNLIFSDSTATG